MPRPSQIEFINFARVVSPRYLTGEKYSRSAEAYLGQALLGYASGYLLPVEPHGSSRAQSRYSPVLAMVLF
jgi:hypothetical protein